jgi:hypothetical protein
VYSLRHIEKIILRGFAILTVVVAVGCVLLPELDSFAWEQSYSKSHTHGKGTFLSAFFDNMAEEDTDGDGTIRVWHSTFPSFNKLSLSFFASQSFEKVDPFPFNLVGQKYFLLHRKLLL